MDTNNTTQETIVLKSNNTPLMLHSATSYNSQTTACTFTHQTTFKAGQNDIQGAKNDSEETDSCAHNYHVLEQPIRDNDYEELDKYEKKG